MEEEVVVYFDMLEVPDEIRSVVQMRHWSEMVFRKKRLLERTRQLFQKKNNTVFFHVKDNADLTECTNHFLLTRYKNYYFFNSSFAIIDEDLFNDFLDKIKYIPESLAIYSEGDICSFLRVNKDEMISLLGLIQSDPNKLYDHLKILFDTKIERFKKEKFYIEIKGYLDFVRFLQTNFSPRYFNSIERKDDVVIKRSTDKEKMKREYTYYHVLPEEMRYFFIPTFNYTELEGTAQYSIERLSIPDLAIQWIHYSISESQFEKLLGRLFGFINSRKKKVIPKDEMVKQADALYLEKVRSRLAQLKKLEGFEAIQNLFTSSTKYDSIDALFDAYYALYAQHRTHPYFAEELVVGHGDFCFSNILYDKRIDLLKLIDPKGSLTLDEAYLDSYYDIAKLSHSILGNYDFINNGLYEFGFDQSLQASIQIKFIENVSRQKNYFKAQLERYGFDYKLVRLCELSLFLSMTPLHIDNKKNVLAFLLNASMMVKELEN